MWPSGNCQCSNRNNTVIIFLQLNSVKTLWDSPTETKTSQSAPLNQSASLFGANQTAEPASYKPADSFEQVCFSFVIIIK